MRAPVPHRALSTLLFRYRNVGDVREVITEGIRDSTALNDALAQSGNRSITATPVEFIAIDADDYDSRLNQNNKGKLLYIARKIADIPDALERVACLVDSDTNAFRGVSEFLSPVIFTDYADLGMYFLTPEASAEIAQFNLHETPEFGRLAFEIALDGATHELAARALMEDRTHRLAIPPSANYVDASTQAFDADGYGTALNSVGIDISDVRRLVRETRGVLPAQALANSHNIAAALLKLFRQRSARAARLRPEELEERFFLLRHCARLHSSLAFEAIIARLSRNRNR